MTIGFYTVFRTDPQHFLHATAATLEAQRCMPGVPIVQFTDEKTGRVPGVHDVRRLPHGQMLERRLEHYAAVDGEWLLVDTDVVIRRDVQAVFEDRAFDVALTDRDWPHLPQPADVLQSMPFNTGVAFSRCQAFWTDTLTVWRGFREDARDWLSEQRAVAIVARTGKYRVKVLSGSIYNYPPKDQNDKNNDAAIWHYKGPRKTWLTRFAYECLSQPL